MTAESNTAPMGQELPPLTGALNSALVDFRLASDDPSTRHVVNVKLMLAIKDYAEVVIAPYADRIRHLEQDNGLLSLIADQFKVRLASADARIAELERDLEQARAAFIGSENARKDAERARGTGQSIDTPEFRALADKWQLCLTTDIERVYAELVAYIDGRTAGTAPEGWKLVPVEPTEEMIQAACLNQASLDTYPNYEAWWNSHTTGISEKIRGYVSSDYKVMIAAAPTPITPKDE